MANRAANCKLKSFSDQVPNFLLKLCEVSGIINDLKEIIIQCQNHCLIEGMSEIHVLANLKELANYVVHLYY